MEKVIITQFSASEIKELFREEIHAYFLDNPINVAALNTQTKVVDLDGLLAARPIIGSRNTIYKKASNGLIPHSKRGKKLFFDLHAIDQWLLENKVKSPSEIEAEAANYLQQKNRR